MYLRVIYIGLWGLLILYFYCCGNIGEKNEDVNYIFIIVEI